MDVDYEKMFTFIKFPWTKSFADSLNAVRKHLTSIQCEIESRVSIDEVYRALVSGFRSALGIRLVEKELTKYEHNLAERLRLEKFSTEEWNLGNQV